MNKQFFYDLADVIDAFRVLPRVFLVAFGLTAIQMLNHAVDYAVLNPESQNYGAAGIAAVTVGAFAKAYEYYLKTGGVRQ